MRRNEQDNRLAENVVRLSDRGACGHFRFQLGEVLFDLRRMHLIAFWLDHELRPSGKHQSTIVKVTQIARVAETIARNGLPIGLRIADISDEHLRAGKANLARFAGGQFVAGRAVRLHRLADR